MARFEKASNDVINLFEIVRDKTTIPQWIKFELLYDNKQNELYKVFKIHDLDEIMTNSVNLVAVFNKEILERLSNYYLEMEFEECLAGICITETDTIALGKPNFDTFSVILEKYGYDSIIALHGVKSKRT